MKHLILFLFIFFAQIAQSQSRWSLQMCIDYALQNNLQLKQSRLNTNAAQQNYHQAKWTYLPELNANASQYFNFGRSLDVTSNSYKNDASINANTFTLNTSIPLFSGFTKFYQLKLSETDVKVTSLENTKLENDIAIQIALNYLGILNNYELLKIAKQQKEISLQQKNQAQKLVRAGVLAEMNLIDVDAALTNDEMNIVAAQNNVDWSVLGLKQLMNFNVNQAFEIDTALKMPTLNELNIELDFNKTYSLAHDFQPIIQANKLKIKSSIYNVNMFKGALLPSLSFFGSLRSSYSSAKSLLVNDNGGIYVGVLKFEDQINKNFGKSVGFNLSIPISNGFQARLQLQRSKLQLQSAKLNFETAEMQLQQEVAKAILNVKSAAAKLETARANALAMKNAFVANTKKYEAGVINNFDFNTSKNNYSKALSDEVNAQYDFYFKNKILNFYQGKPIY